MRELAHAHNINFCPIDAPPPFIRCDCSIKMSSISPDEVAAPLGVDSKELDKPCTETSFSSITDLVHPWRLVFADLLCQTDLDDVDRDSHSQPEKRLGCLRKWRSRCGDGATFRAIIAAVLSTGNVENAQALCRIIATSKKKFYDITCIILSEGLRA